MDKTLKPNRIDTRFIQQLESKSSQQLSHCYQCGKCSAGCPIACSVEPPPHKIMRMAQLGLKRPVLSSPTIWLCLSCVTCTARCPKGVDLARIMDVLRELAIEEGVADTQKQKIKIFERLFLHSIRRYGRLYEIGAMIQFNLRTFQPFESIELLPQLIRKGKLGFKPKSIKAREEMELIFKKLGGGDRA